MRSVLHLPMKLTSVSPRCIVFLPDVSGKMTSHLRDDASVSRGQPTPRCAQVLQPIVSTRRTRTLQSRVASARCASLRIHQRAYQSSLHLPGVHISRRRIYLPGVQVYRIHPTYASRRCIHPASASVVAAFTPVIFPVPGVQVYRIHPTYTSRHRIYPADASCCRIPGV